MKPYVKIDDCVITDSNEIDNAFNTYFIIIGKSLSEQMHSNHDYTEYLNNSNLRFKFN